MPDRMRFNSIQFWLRDMRDYKAEDSKTKDDVEETCGHVEFLLRQLAIRDDELKRLKRQLAFARVKQSRDAVENWKKE